MTKILKIEKSTPFSIGQIINVDDSRYLVTSIVQTVGDTSANGTAVIALEIFIECIDDYEFDKELN